MGTRAILPCELRGEAGIKTVKLEGSKILQRSRSATMGNVIYTGVESRQDVQGHSDEQQFLDEGMDGR
jgi:hypothetical protein